MINLSLEQETSQKYTMKEIMSQAKNGNALPEGDYILIMPFASSWQDKEGNWHENAKNYPFWNELVKAIKLTYPKLKVIQTGLGMEPAVDGIDEKRSDLTLQQLRDLLLGSKTFISSDTYLQHAGAKYGKRGIVLWGMNNPKYFGHKLHENLYVSSQYFRKDVWSIWQGVARVNESFVRPGVVLAALKEELKRQEELPVVPIDEAYPPIPGVSWAPKLAKELRELIKVVSREADEKNGVEYISSLLDPRAEEVIKNGTPVIVKEYNHDKAKETLFQELQLELH